MAYFTNRIAVTQSDLSYSVSNHYGTGNGIASEDQQTWGESLEINNVRNRLEFSKKYLNFTFEIERSSVNEFARISYGAIKLYNKSNEVVYAYQYKDPFGSNNDEMGMYSSQANETLGNWVVKSDVNMLIRAQIDTVNVKSLGYHCFKISEIKKVHCAVYTSSGALIEKIWDLENEATIIYQSCTWKNDGWKDTIHFNKQYTQRLISPKLSYNGTINIYSKIYDSDAETSCGKHYFLGTENGKIRMTMSDVKFFGATAKDITKLFFSGVDTSSSKKIEHSVTVTFDNDAPTTYDFLSSSLKEFSKIDSIFVCFGNDNNKIPISTFSGNFLNTDVSSNMSVKFQQTSGINNKDIEITEKGNPIKAREELKGSLTLDSDYPYVLQENSYITLVSDKEYKLQEDQNLRMSSMESGNLLTINYGHDYEIKENNDKNTLNINDVCKLKTGEYELKYNVINKLNVNSNSAYEHTFTFVSGHGIKINTNKSCYVAFDDSSSNIKYPHNETLYNVDGIIIIPNEEIVFSNVPQTDNDNEVRIYEVAVGETNDPNECVKNTKITRIGLHKDFHPNNLQSELISNLTTEGKLRISYDTLKDWFEEGSDEQKTLYLSGIASTTINDISVSVYTQPKKYILGRIKTPIYDGLKVENKKIKYFLTDNGCDQIISSDSKKFQNDFINDRVNNIGNGADFSISRNLGATFAKERLRLSISREQKQIGSFLIKIKSSNKTTREPSNAAPYTTEFFLNEALQLLKTNQINEIDIDEIIDSMSIDIIGAQGKQELKNNLKSAPFDLKISPEYVYDEDNDIYQELFSIYLPNINLSPDVIPIGLRKDGVIINPKEGGNEKLNEIDSTDKKNTFVVNVNNVTKLDGGKYEDINGLKISFSNPKIDNGVQSLQEVAYFEIFLNSNGEICFSNGEESFNAFETIEAFSKIKAIQKHLNLSDEQLENLLSS